MMQPQDHTHSPEKASALKETPGNQESTSGTGRPQYALEFRDACFAYGERQVLSGITLQVPAGEFFCLIGPNGAGKTTLLRLAAGALLPASGSVSLGGQHTSGLEAREKALLAAFVHQTETVAFPFSVRGMVLMGRFARLGSFGYESDEDHTAAEKAMRLTDVQELAGRPVTELSGGELHRVTIARALAQDTPILFLDEPNAHLDIRHQLRLFSLLRRLNREEGRSIICVVHDLNLAAMFADRIALIDHGELAALGTASEVLTTAHLHRHFGVHTRIVPGVEDGRPHIMLLHEDVDAQQQTTTV